MKARYYREDDLLVLQVADKPYHQAEKIGSFIIHFTSDGEPVMVEILQATRFLKEAAAALPYPAVAKVLGR